MLAAWDLSTHGHPNYPLMTPLHQSPVLLLELMKFNWRGTLGPHVNNNPFAYDSSSSVTSPAVGTDKNQTMEGSTESERTFGDLQAFPVDDLFHAGLLFLGDISRP
ncbi:hypothetical protein CK203_044268 [Vitis vinifera]|uniref:Uncharacterized protein n=1 Tax=Vitis vinifera TaxID=29760 RepID=A0A438GV89_VITVI|nr:hypothetical protein CK203_044268 [Vitis vinifera]